MDEIGRERSEPRPQNPIKAPKGMEPVLEQVREASAKFPSERIAMGGDLHTINERAQAFEADPSAENFGLFVKQFVSKTAEDGSISQFEQAALAPLRVWEDLAGEALHVYSIDQLATEKAQLRANRAVLASNPVARVKHARKVAELDRQIRTADFYASLYENHVRPALDERDAVKKSLAAAVEQVYRSHRGNFKDNSPTNLQKEIEKGESLDKLEDIWLKTAVEEPLTRMRDKFIEGRREGPDYSDADAERDGAIFDNLKGKYVDFVRSRTEAEPKTQEAWSQTFNEWENDQQRVLLEQGFSVLGLGREFNDFISGLTFRGNSSPLRDNTAPADKEFDLRPRNAYKEWTAALDSFLGYEYSPWRVPELEEAIERGQEKYTPEARLLDELRRAAQDAARGKNYISFFRAEDWLELPSFDRWPALKKYLAENDLVPAERLEAFDNAIISKLVYGVLIPGGHESWPGTDACGKLSVWGSPKVLEHLLFYQTYISGASGLYKAGHTNAVAQGVLEKLLRGTSAEEIGALDTPDFVKDALQSLKDFHGNLQEDSYGRSAMTATLITRNFVGAAREISENWEKPGYPTWAVALLRGMRNSRQAFGKEAYGAAVSFIDLEDKGNDIQKEVVSALAFRIGNREELGIERRINEDSSLALETLSQLMRRSGFKKSIDNMNALITVINTLRNHLEFSGYSQEELERYNAHLQDRGLGRMAMPTPEDIERDRSYLETFRTRLEEWMHDESLTGEVKFQILKTFDFLDYDYPQTIDVAIGLYLDQDLAKYAEAHMGSISSGGLSMTVYGSEKWRHIEDLTSLLVSRYLKFGDERAKDVMIETFIRNPSTRKGVIEFFKDWSPDNYTKEKSAEFNQILESFNNYLLGGDEEVARAVKELFDERIYYGLDTYLRDLVLADVDLASSEKKSFLFDSLIRMVQNNQRFIGKHAPEGVDDKNYRFGQETIDLIAQRMPAFLDSDSLTEQFWAVYALFLAGERGEKFRNTLNRLIEQREELEKEVEDAKAGLNQMKTDLDIEDVSGGL